MTSSLVLNTNVPSIVAYNNLTFHTNQVNRAMEHLASGSRINRAADDAAGLTIAQALKSQIVRMDQAARNAQDGISVLQVAEGALSVIGDSLQRVRELAVQAASDTYSTAARDAQEAEIMSLLRDVDRISQSTLFNNIQLLNGTATNAILQIGPNSTLGTNTMNISAALTAAGTGDPAGPGGLGIVGGAATFATIAAIGTTGINNTNALTFLNDLDRGINAITAQRSTLGSFSNQLENVTQNLASSSENFNAAHSRIRDLDIASEMSVLTQEQILQQATVGVLSQTNKIPQMILDLLQNR